MTTVRRYKDYWTETKRIVNGEVKSTICACPLTGAGRDRKTCSQEKGCKTPCRCLCHKKD